MTLFGSEDAKEFLTTAIDEKKLVRLAADVLVRLGCTHVIVTDGPGDGTRDIHGRTPKDRELLAQCKFHEDPSRTCSNAELGELPLGMTKLGYTIGVFITNASISPPAKREYLDNYPDLHLRFLDGDSLARIVVSDPVLRALWFDGQSIARVGTRLHIPLIARRHDDDAPVVPLRRDPIPSPHAAMDHWSGLFPDLSLQFAPATFHAELLEPYRLPEPRTHEEGVASFLIATEAVVTGDHDLVDVGRIVRHAAASWMAWVGGVEDRVTVRVGTPSLTPLSGGGAGTSLKLNDHARSTLVQTARTCAEEREFFSVDHPGGGWTKENDARVNEAYWIRLTHRDIDCAVACEIVGRPSVGMTLFRVSENEFRWRAWLASVFALVPAFAAWPYEHIPAPDETITWPWDSRILCGWLHPELQGGPVLVRSANHDERVASFGSDTAGPDLPSVRDLLTVLDGVEILDPKKAYHMVALVGNDWIHDVTTMTHHTCDVAHHLDGVPSPILPDSRRFRLDVAFEIAPECDVEDEWVESLASLTASEGVRDPWWHWHEPYLTCEAELAPPNLADDPTWLILVQLEPVLRAWIEDCTERFRAAGKIARLTTREYWARVHNVTLGCDWSESRKAYAWTAGADGWVAIQAGSAYDQSRADEAEPVGLTADVAEFFLLPPPNEAVGSEPSSDS